MSWFRRSRHVTIGKTEGHGRHERRGRHEAIEPFGYISFSGDWTAEEQLAFASNWLQQQQRDLTPYSLQFKRDA